MLQEIFAYIRKFHSPEASLVVILLLGATLTLGSIYQKSSNKYTAGLEVKNSQLEAQKDSIQRSMQLALDNCKESSIQERLDKIRQLENYSRLQDSIIKRLRAIK